MTPTRRRLLYAVFATTGFAALALQVVWERVISLHNGVDLSSAVTVVAAFLLGLGVGSLAGGALADRIGPVRAVRAYAAANIGVGLYAFISIWLLYDVYESAASGLSSPIAKFGFNLLVIFVPTVLMGLSTPLLVRGLVARIDTAGAVAGRLYAVNTLGAALGAGICGWVLIGALGFVTTTRLAGLLSLLAAVVVLALTRGVVADASEDIAVPEQVAPGDPGARTWPWELAYAGTGAIALGLQVVFFRFVDGIMRSNSYSFAHVLTLYLVLYGLGNAIGARLVGRSRDPGRAFLVVQFFVGIGALLGPVVLVQVLPAVGLEGTLRGHFSGDGFNSGFSTGLDHENARLLFAYGAAPLLVMAIPVVLMGVSFPFVQAAVSQRFETLGRRTGRLLFANIAGNVFGTLVTGFVLLENIGTAGTLRLLAVLLAIPGVVVVGRRDSIVTRRVGLAGAAMVVLLLVAPSNLSLWSFLHGVPTSDLSLSEGRACAAALKFQEDGRSSMYVNASSQNGYPFDDFHVLIGLLPSLLQEDPERALAIGMGIGSTTYGMAEDTRLNQLDTVELCGGQFELLRDLAGSSPELALVYSDPRVRLHRGDGRSWLLTHDEPYDLITADTLRPTAANSGSLYSQEFYELVRDRLTPSGVFAQWVPTGRSANTVASVFPYVSLFPTDYFGGSVFLVASSAPLGFDRDDVRSRFTAAGPSSVLSDPQRASIADYFATVQVQCLVAGEVVELNADQINRDLFPRDEYFLNQRPEPTVAAAC